MQITFEYHTLGTENGQMRVEKHLNLYHKWAQLGPGFLTQAGAVPVNIKVNMVCLGWNFIFVKDTY